MENGNYIKNLSDAQVIRMYSEVIKELKEREIILTKNVIGELGEYYAIELYNKTVGLPNLQRTQTVT